MSAAATGRALANITTQLLTRVLRLVFVVPVAAFALHLARADVPWWSWCGICGASLVGMWAIEGGVAFVRGRCRPRDARR